MCEYDVTVGWEMTHIYTDPIIAYKLNDQNILKKRMAYQQVNFVDEKKFLLQ